MTKERIILAFVAVAAGLIVASSSFYFYQQKSVKNTPQQESPSQATPTKTSAILEIEAPENESITDEKTVELKGKSLPQSIIVLSTNTNDFVLSADENGAFSQKITLSEDENLIAATAYTDNGSETKELTITYTTEEF